MIKSFKEAEIIAGEVGPKKIAVLRAENREFLLALKESYRRGYGEPILIGNEAKIRDIADDIEFDISNFSLINEKDHQKIANKGVELVSEGKTDFILRGYIDGHYLYRTLIRSSSKSGVKKQISVVGLIQLPGFPKLIGMTDPGVTVAPDFDAKLGIVRNAVDLFSHLGYNNPRVGCLTAQRGFNDDLDSVTDAVKMRETVSSGELKGYIIEEGLCLSDFFLGENDFLENYGEIDYSLIPDILLVHNIEFGNIFAKIDSLSTEGYFPGWERHGIIMGAGIPTVAPSRADKYDTIITDIALGVLIA